MIQIFFAHTDGTDQLKVVQEVLADLKRRKKTNRQSEETQNPFPPRANPELDDIKPGDLWEERPCQGFDKSLPNLQPKIENQIYNAGLALKYYSSKLLTYMRLKNSREEKNKVTHHLLAHDHPLVVSVAGKQRHHQP